MVADYDVNADYCYVCETDYDFIGHSVGYRVNSHSIYLNNCIIQLRLS